MRARNSPARTSASIGVTWPPSSAASSVMSPSAGEPRVDEREAVRLERRRAVHDVEMQVRAVGVAGVAEQPQHLALADAIALSHPHAAGLHVRVEGPATLADPHDDVVAPGRLHGLARRQSARRLLGHAVLDVDDLARRGGVDARAEEAPARERVDRPSNSRPLRSSRTKSIAKRSGDAHGPVDRERRAAVGVDRVAAAVADDPARAPQRRRDLDRATPPTRVGTPTKATCWSGSPGALSVRSKPWVRRCGRVARLA